MAVDVTARSSQLQDLCGGAFLFAHRPHEAEALAAQRLDQPLAVAAVADRGTRRIDARRQRRIRNDPPVPDRGQ
jgi:hypothetical protein